MDLNEEDTPLLKLHQAIQEFSNTLTDEPAIVMQGLVVWERVRPDDDGDMIHQIKYAVTGDGVSMAACLGLNEVAGEYIRQDLISEREEDD